MNTALAQNEHVSPEPVYSQAAHLNENNKTHGPNETGDQINRLAQNESLDEANADTVITEPVEHVPELPLLTITPLPEVSRHANEVGTLHQSVNLDQTTEENIDYELVTEGKLNIQPLSSYQDIEESDDDRFSPNPLDGDLGELNTNIEDNISEYNLQSKYKDIEGNQEDSATDVNKLQFIQPENQENVEVVTTAAPVTLDEIKEDETNKELDFEDEDIEVSGENNIQVKTLRAIVPESTEGTSYKRLKERNFDDRHVTNAYVDKKIKDHISDIHEFNAIIKEEKEQIQIPLNDGHEIDVVVANDEVETIMQKTKKDVNKNNNSQSDDEFRLVNSRLDNHNEDEKTYRDLSSNTVGSNRGNPKQEFITKDFDKPPNTKSGYSPVLRQPQISMRDLKRDSIYDPILAQEKLYQKDLHKRIETQQQDVNLIEVPRLNLPNDSIDDFTRDSLDDALLQTTEDFIYNTVGSTKPRVRYEDISKLNLEDREELGSYNRITYDDFDTERLYKETYNLANENNSSPRPYELAGDFPLHQKYRLKERHNKLELTKRETEIMASSRFEDSGRYEDLNEKFNRRFKPSPRIKHKLPSPSKEAGNDRIVVKEGDEMSRHGDDSQLVTRPPRGDLTDTDSVLMAYDKTQQEYHDNVISGNQEVTSQRGFPVEQPTIETQPTQQPGGNTDFDHYDVTSESFGREKELIQADMLQAQYYQGTGYADQANPPHGYQTDTGLGGEYYYEKQGSEGQYNRVSIPHATNPRAGINSSDSVNQYGGYNQRDTYNQNAIYNQNTQLNHDSGYIQNGHQNSDVYVRNDQQTQHPMMSPNRNTHGPVVNEPVYSQTVNQNQQNNPPNFYQQQFYPQNGYQDGVYQPNDQHMYPQNGNRQQHEFSESLINQPVYVQYGNGPNQEPFQYADENGIERGIKKLNLEQNEGGSPSNPSVNFVEKNRQSTKKNYSYQQTMDERKKKMAAVETQREKGDQQRAMKKQNQQKGGNRVQGNVQQSHINTFGNQNNASFTNNQSTFDTVDQHGNPQSNFESVEELWHHRANNLSGNKTIGRQKPKNVENKSRSMPNVRQHAPLDPIPVKNNAYWQNNDAINQTRGDPQEYVPQVWMDQEGMPQGYPNQGGVNQGYSNQGGMNQGYPNQGGINQGYPNQAGMNQGYPNQGGMNQGYPNQGGLNQGYPNQGGMNQGRSMAVGGGMNSGGMDAGQGLDQSQGVDYRRVAEGRDRMTYNPHEAQPSQWQRVEASPRALNQPSYSTGNIQDFHLPQERVSGSLSARDHVHQDPPVLGQVQHGSSPTNPYPTIPPIAVDNRSPNAQNGGYAALYQQKRNRKGYKAYTINDYRKMQKEVSLGGLGPDLDSETLKERTEKKIKQTAYAKTINERNRNEIALSKPPKFPRPHDEPDVATKRRLAQEYSRTVPKPKATVAPTTHDDVPAIKSPSSKRGTPRLSPSKNNPEMIDLDKLKERHERDKQNVAVIRNKLEPGVVPTSS